MSRPLALVSWLRRLVWPDNPARSDQSQAYVTPCPDDNLQANNDFLNIAENSVQGIIVNALDRQVLYVNKKSVEIFGYNRAEELTAFDDVLNLMTESDRERVSQLRYSKGSGANNVVDIDFEAVRKDGSTVFVAGTAADTVWQGKPARFTTFVDVTEKRKIEQQQRKDHARFLRFAEISSDWFWELDRDLRYSYISEKFRESGGMHRESYIGQTPRALYASYVGNAGYDEYVRKLDAHEKIENLEVLRMLPKQQPVWLQINAAPVFDELGEFTGYQGTTIDITSRLETEKALKDSEERFETATRDSGVSIWDWHVDSDDYFVSAQAAFNFGYTEDNKPRTRQDWFDLVHPDDSDAHILKLRQYLRGKSSLLKSEYRTRCADGSYRRIQIQGSGTRDPDGKVHRLAGWGIDVTEQRNTERLLSEAVNSISEGFALFDADDRLIVFNQNYADLFTPMNLWVETGMKYEDILRQFTEYDVTVNGAEISETEIEDRILAHRNPPPVAERQMPDGNWIRTTEVRTPSGNIAGLRSKITEHRNLLDQLAASEERFRAFADVASDWYFEMDRDLRHTYMSEGVIRTRGLTPDFFLGHRHDELFPDDVEREPTQEEYARHLENRKEKRGIVVRRINDQQQTKWTRINLLPKYDEDGEFDGYYGSSRDVTEQIENQLALEQKEAQVSGMLEIAPDAIITVGGDFRIQIFNHGASNIFGYSEEEILGESLDLLIPERFRGMHQGYMVDFDKTGDTSRRMEDRLEIIGLRKDGTEFPAEASLSRLKIGDNILLTAMLHDISDRKETEKVVQQSMEEALYASRAKSEFLANMSHELRTPLNAILGFSQALEAGIKGPVSSDQQEYVDAISQSGEHLLSLINDILDLSKLEAGKADIEEEELLVSDIVNQARLLIGDRAREGQIDLYSLVNDNDIRLRGDKRMVLQILLNLLSNAVKFTLPGGSVTITAATTAAGEIELSVSDTGIGMEPREIPRALSTFGQLDGDLDRRHEGTGLGLPLVKSLVELHDSDLRIESSPGSGTTVSVIFPPERLI